MIYSWLKDAQLLMMRADKQEWLIAMPLRELLDMFDEIPRINEMRRIVEHFDGDAPASSTENASSADE